MRLIGLDSDCDRFPFTGQLVAQPRGGLLNTMELNAARAVAELGDKVQVRIHP